MGIRVGRSWALCLWLLLVVACGDEDGVVRTLDSGVPSKTVNAQVGVEGGTVELANGGKVEIPAGALTTTESIKVTELEDTEVAALPNNLEVAGKPYAFEPHGLTFVMPVKITLPIEGDDTEARPVKLNDSDDTEWTTVFPSTKTTDRKLELQTTSFSVYMAARPRRITGVVTLPDGAVTVPASDAGTEAGVDAGVDGGADAGIDAGPDASVDAGADAGADASVDASPSTYVKASNTSTDAEFGFSVAIDGDTMVVGAPGDSSNATGINGNSSDTSAPVAGAAHVYVRSGGVWMHQAYLKASNTQEYASFGRSVAISGDTILVGAYGEGSGATTINGSQTSDGLISAGAAFVFVRVGTTWSQQAYLKADNTRQYASFGWSVAIDGDTAVVGAHGESSGATGINGNGSDESAPRAGAAYVFVRSGTAWSQQAYVKASYADADDEFGYRVAVSGDTVVVSAIGEASGAAGINGDGSDNSLLGSGAAYVFTRSGTTWTQQSYLKAAIAREGTGFGASLAADADTVVVGAWGDPSDSRGAPTTDTQPDSGAAYVFVRVGTTWSQQAFLKASNPLPFDYFAGQSVALRSDTIVVGAWGEDVNAFGVNGTPMGAPIGESGAAFVFTRSGTTWTQQSYLKANTPGLYDYFGYAVALSGTTIVVGARGEDGSATGIGGNEVDDAVPESGAVYVFE